MEFLKWYLIIGVIVDVISIIYNAKMNAYRGIDTIKSFNIFAKVVIYCCVFALDVICWLPISVFGIVYIIKDNGDSYTGYIVGIWKDEKSLAVRSKLIIGYICLFIAACILWLPIIIFDSVDFILDRLNK